MSLRTARRSAKAAKKRAMAGGGGASKKAGARSTAVSRRSPQAERRESGRQGRRRSPKKYRRRRVPSEGKGKPPSTHSAKDDEGVPLRTVEGARTKFASNRRLPHSPTHAAAAAGATSAAAAGATSAAGHRRGLRKGAGRHKTPTTLRAIYGVPSRAKGESYARSRSGAFSPGGVKLAQIEATDTSTAKEKGGAAEELGGKNPWEAATETVLAMAVAGPSALPAANET
jgi:hypothetical protein